MDAETEHWKAAAEYWRGVARQLETWFLLQEPKPVVVVRHHVEVLDTRNFGNLPVAR